MKNKKQKPECPSCGSRSVLTRRTDKVKWCRVCGFEWNKENAKKN